jgi:hypothetical protein
MRKMKGRLPAQPNESAMSTTVRSRSSTIARFSFQAIALLGVLFFAQSCSATSSTTPATASCSTNIAGNVAGRSGVQAPDPRDNWT